MRTDRLSIVPTLDLIHHPDGPPLPIYSLAPSAETFPFSCAADEIPDLARLTERQLPDPEWTVDAWARQFIGEQKNARTLDVLEAMTRAIANFRYDARHEEGTQAQPRHLNSTRVPAATSPC